MTTLAMDKPHVTSSRTLGLRLWRGSKISLTFRPAQLNSLLFLWSFKAVILVVSAYDIYLTIKYLEFMPELEQNPIGRWLLGVDRGPMTGLQQAATFITAKFAGNVLVLAVLEALATWGFRLVGVVAGSVALFQIVLCGYLILATNTN